ncbi:MAG: hypothetical protein OHK006_21500 [Thermodesulfovibrionales bacterium]
MTDSIEQRVLRIVSDISGFEPEEISRTSRFFDDLEIDSIKAIEVTVAIEKAFRISVRDEDVPKILTVQDAIDTVEKLIDKKNV